MIMRSEYNRAYDGPKIVKAMIAGEIVVIDLASDKRDSYKEISDRIEYLGYGEYYSFDGNVNTDNGSAHFWRFKI